MAVLGFNDNGDNGDNGHTATCGVLWDRQGGYGLWGMGYGLWVMGYGLWVMGGEGWEPAFDLAVCAPEEEKVRKMGWRVAV